MIDIHAHILPNLDDGPSSMEESIELCHRAALEGIKKIIASPHVFSPRGNSSLEDMRNAVSELNTALQQQGIDLEVLPACEVHAIDDIAHHYQRGRIIGLNDSRYILVEFPKSRLPKTYREVIYNLQLQGLVPVLAHPERNGVFLSQPERLLELIEKGCLTQLTASSLTGLWGPSVQAFATKMVQHNWAHVIATDIHKPTGKRLCLREAVEVVAKLTNPETADDMVNKTPKLIIENKNVKALRPQPFVEEDVGFVGKLRSLFSKK